MVWAANLLVLVLAIYAGLGLVFAVGFVLRGVDAIDAQARQSSWGFRLIIVPGVVALWPVLARRWIARRPLPVERTAHRAATEQNRG